MVDRVSGSRPVSPTPTDSSLGGMSTPSSSPGPQHHLSSPTGLTGRASEGGAPTLHHPRPRTAFPRAASVLNSFESPRSPSPGNEGFHTPALGLPTPPATPGVMHRGEADGYYGQPTHMPPTPTHTPPPGTRDFGMHGHVGANGSMMEHANYLAGQQIAQGQQALQQNQAMAEASTHQQAVTTGITIEQTLAEATMANAQKQAQALAKAIKGIGTAADQNAPGQ